MAPETAPQGQSLIEFLNTVPAPIVTVLVGLGAPIAALRRALEVVSWKAPWTDSWLLVAAWWAVCLLAQPALRYALPLTVAGWVAWRQWRVRKAPAPPPPVAETTLQMSISDLTTINTLLPRRAPQPNVASPSTPATTPPATEPVEPISLPDPKFLLRLAALLTIPYLILTFFIPLRILVGIAGTVVLTYRAPWASRIRAALWRSAHVRFACYRAWAYLSGRPLPTHLGTPGAVAQSLKLASAGTQSAADALPAPTPELRFLFTVHENQRWWMGLDWTAALLPGERPSWCAPSLQAVSPPAAFALPAPTAVYMPVPGAAGSAASSPRSSLDSSQPSSEGAPGQTRVKRTATWRWAEPEWRVLVRPTSTSPSARIERPLPTTPDPETQSSSSRIFGKAAARMRGESGGAAVGHPKEPAGEGEGDKAVKASDGVKEEEEPVTDGDGWVYADNKWEGQSGKGGMGKYTRYRRWTRIAVLTETVELVGPGETGVVPGPHPATRPRTDSRADAQTPGSVKAQPIASPTMSAGSVPPSPAAKPSPVKQDRWDNSLAKMEESPEKEDAGSLLRQRLRAAVKGQTPHA